jgi:DNA-binding NarL/FixJ family response regulator
MKYRLIIADDHEVLRLGLRDLVARTSDLEVVAEAGDGPGAERLARELAADLLVLELALPGASGVRVLEHLRADGIKLPVLLFSTYGASQYVEHARKVGAQGFVAKSESSGEVLRSIREVLAGREAFPAGGSVRAEPGPEGNPFAGLSRRESEVMRGLLLGHSLQRIAEDLAIGAKSVTTYRRRLLDKLGVQSNVELAALAARHGRF